MFDSTIKKVNSTNTTLKHLLLEVTSKRLGEEKVLFNCLNRFEIQDFGNIWH